MSANLRLQRLVYPFREKSIPKNEFGSSAIKFGAITNFFTCAVMAQPSFAKGQIQNILDDLFINRKQVVGHTVDVHFEFAKACGDSTKDCTTTHTRPLFVLGQRNKLGAFEKTLMASSQAYQNDSPLLISGLREFMIADFLSQSACPEQEEQLNNFSLGVHSNTLNNTMGWLDLESGCFAMRSMNGLNRVRELFGMRPHMAMTKQRHNYPS